MIFSIFIYLISALLYFFTVLLPKINIYPPVVLDAFTYFGECIMTVNFILPAYEFLTIVIFLIQFEVYIFLIKIISTVINTVRGGNVVDI